MLPKFGGNCEKASFVMPRNELRTAVYVYVADRVRCCQWVRKLSSIPTTDFENAKLRNDYIQLLRIQVKCGGLHGIFTETPLEGNLKPLSEALVRTFIITALPPLTTVQSDKFREKSDGFDRRIPTAFMQNIMYLNPINFQGSYILKNCPHLPPVGPIAPIICHRTLDGRAYLSIKHVPGHGVLCYMAASPDGV